jgi:hypothetical protein
MIMLFHIELPARGLKIQAEVVTEEESTPVAADQVEEPSNWVACRGI